MTEISEAVAERVGADPDLTEEIEAEMQMRLAREALETAESVDSIIDKAVSGDIETEDTSDHPDPYFADLIDDGNRLRLTYESSRQDAGEQEKDVEVASSRSWVGSEGFQHWDVHLRDLDRRGSNNMKAEFIVDGGEVVHSSVYGYSSGSRKAKEYGRQLGHQARLSEPQGDEAAEEENGDEDEEQPDTEDSTASSGMLMGDARNVVAENDLETSDWPTFQSEMISMDYSQSDASEAWSGLKSEGLIDEPKESVPPWEREDEDGGGDEEPGQEESDVDAPDELWLMTTDDCPGCGRAKDLLSEYIPDPIQVRNVQEDDEMIDIVMEADLPRQTPLLIRVDGNELTIV